MVRGLVIRDNRRRVMVLPLAAYCLISVFLASTVFFTVSARAEKQKVDINTIEQSLSHLNGHRLTELNQDYYADMIRK